MTDVDCDGCTAPCCKRNVFFHEHEAEWCVTEEHLVRQVFARQGAILIQVGVTDSGLQRFDCQAQAADGRCGVYANRPDVCRSYDCRDDLARSDGENGATCEWPRAA
jgi:Fe-S-cluster containining protein